MNFAAFERAQVAAFAYREARHTGNLDCMRAVCFVIRNRVKSGWGDGSSWLSVVAQSHYPSAHFAPFMLGEVAPLNGPKEWKEGEPLSGAFKSDDRLLQFIIRDVDDIYLSQDRFDDNVRRTMCGEDSSVKLGSRDWKPVLYYSFIDKEPRPWFVENIIRQPKDHPHVGQIGKMLLYR